MKRIRWLRWIVPLLAAMLWLPAQARTAVQELQDEVAPTAASYHLYMARIVSQTSLASALPAQTDSPSVYLPTIIGPQPLPPPSAWVTPAQGGTVSTPDGSLTVIVPPGAVTRRTELTLASPTASAPGMVSDLGLAFDITARDDQGQPVTTLAAQATLIFRYRDTELALISPPEEYAIYSQGADGAWTALPTTLNPVTRQAQAQTDHFSHFGLFAPALSGRLGGPNTGDVACRISDDFPVYSMGLDHTGNLYFLHGAHYMIYRRPPNAGREVLYAHFDVREIYSGTDTAHGIDVDPTTGVIYLNRNRRVFRINPDGSWRQLYPAAGTEGCRISPMRFDGQSGTLWVGAICGSGRDTVYRYDQIHTDNGRLLRSLPQQGGGLPITDARGRLFGRGRTMEDGSTSLLRWDEEREEWRLIAQGFLGAGGLTTDDHGNLYVANANANAISVIGGDTPFVTGVIWTDRAPRALRYVNGRLLMSSGGAISTLPAARRDRLDGNANSVETTYAGTVSGNGSLVTLTGDLSVIPAHHAVSVGDVRLRLLSHSSTELHYFLPYYERVQPYPNQPFVRGEDDGLPFVGTQVRMTVPSGMLKVQVNTQQRSFGQLQTPELGQFQPYRNSYTGRDRSCMDEPLDVALGEWVIWWTSQEPNAHTLTAASAGFKDWSSATGGPWVAHQFDEAGEFDFVMSGSSWGNAVTCTIRVTDHGAPHYTRVYQVNPSLGGVYHHNGVRLEVPAGALPGSAPYTVTMRTRDEASPVAHTPQLTEAGYRRMVEFQPEPDRLLQAIRLSLPRGTAAAYAAPAFYDNALNDSIALPYRQRTYIPLEHTVADGYVHLVLAAGEYPGLSTPSGSRTAGRLDAAAEAEPTPTWGQRLSARINDLGGNIWWKVGLPNEKLENEFFTVLYNTRENITGGDANVVLQSLNRTRAHFQSKGYIVPNSVIVVLHRDNSIGGSASGLGRLMHWKMTVGAWQTDAEMRSATAHELFHIIQYENMSYAARAQKALWAWWMEGTAVWAETQIYPNSNSAAYWVELGSDFIHKGMDSYWRLSSDQSYASVALITHLEKFNPGSVLAILEKLGVEYSPQSAMQEVVGGQSAMYSFFFDFAKTYLSQQAEPYKSWDLTRAVKAVTLDWGATTLLSEGTLPGLSARGYRIVAETADVPASFSAATGSVLRAVHPALRQYSLALDAGGAVLAQITSSGGQTIPQAGVPLPKAETFTDASPLRVLHINGDSAGASAQVYLEVPTLNGVSPATFEAVRSVYLQGNGFGFGAVKGNVEINGVASPADAWGLTSIFKSLPGNSVAPGSVSVRVQHAAGVYSNACTITAE